MSKPPPAGLPAVTVEELLDQAATRLDDLCVMSPHLDPALFELWRALAHLTAAVRQLAAERPASTTRTTTGTGTGTEGD